MIDELDGARVKEVLGSETRNVVIDFWSPWCSPCRALRPHLNKFAEERAAAWRFVAVNVEEHPDAAESFGVKGLPTLVLFKGGEEVHRFAGQALPSLLDAKLDEIGAPLRVVAQ